MTMSKKQSAKILIYSKVPCPYCVAAKRFLEGKGLTFEEIDLTGQFDKMDEIKQETGWRSFPIILINSKLIGGYDDMKTLEERGELDLLIY